MKRLAFLVVAAVLAGMSAFADADKEAVAAAPDDVDARLDEARQRLDEAARTVAELTAEQVKASITATHKRRAALGLVLAPDKSGLVVAGVTPGGGAAKAGLEPGDVIVAINGVPVERPESPRDFPKMLHLLGDAEPGDVVRVEYERDGARAAVDVTTQEHPAFAFGGIAAAAGDIDELPTIEFFDGPPPPLPPDVPMPPEGPMFFTKRLHGGLELHDLDEKLGHYFGVSSGVLVLSTRESDEGLEPGDVVKTVAGTAVATARDCYRALGAAKEDVTVEVLRDGGTAMVEVQPIARNRAWFTPAAGVRGVRVIRATGDDTPDTRTNVDVILHEE